MQPTRGKASVCQNRYVTVRPKLHWPQIVATVIPNGAQRCLKPHSKYPKVTPTCPCYRPEERHSYGKFRDVAVRPTLHWPQTVATAIQNGAQRCLKQPSKYSKAIPTCPCHRSEERHSSAKFRDVTVRPKLHWPGTVATAIPNGAQRCPKPPSKYHNATSTCPCNRPEERHSYAKFRDVTVRPKLDWRETVATAIPNQTKRRDARNRLRNIPKSLLHVPATAPRKGIRMPKFAM